MNIISLTKAETKDIADAMLEAKYEVLVAFDPIDNAFKIKIDGVRWSPPMGKLVITPSRAGSSGF